MQFGKAGDGSFKSLNTSPPNEALAEEEVKHDSYSEDEGESEDLDQGTLGSNGGLETLQTPPSAESAGGTSKKRRTRGERKKGTSRGPKIGLPSVTPPTVNIVEEDPDQTVVVSSMKGQNFEDFAKSIIMSQKTSSKEEENMWNVKIGGESPEQEDIIVHSAYNQLVLDQKLSTDESVTSNQGLDTLPIQHMVMFKQSSLPP